MSVLNPDGESLHTKQVRFVFMIAELIYFARQSGLELTFGEAYRTPGQAAMNAKNGKGIAHSLHTLRLAVDFNLFVNGVYDATGQHHEPLGVYWESIGGSWGGRFGDPNHYSLAYNGVK